MLNTAGFSFDRLTGIDIMLSSKPWCLSGNSYQKTDLNALFQYRNIVNSSIQSQNILLTSELGVGFVSWLKCTKCYTQLPHMEAVPELDLTVCATAPTITSLYFKFKL